VVLRPRQVRADERFHGSRMRVAVDHVPPSEENDMSDGKVDQAKGRAKEAAGDLGGDQSLKNEGKVDKASGKAKNAVSDTADKLKDAVNPKH